MQVLGALGFSAICFYVQSVTAVDVDVNSTMNEQMKLAPTMLDQQKIINNEYVYDFSTNPQYSWQPGSVANANAATFPTLTGTGMMVAQLNLGPCAMLPPHLHRATNLVVATTGTTHTFMIQENGAQVIETHLSPGQMTMFPAASMHSMVNEGCTNNTLYSFLNSEDAGTLNIANAFWAFGQPIGTSAMPMLNINASDWNATGGKIPPIGTGSVLATGYTECLQKCNMQS